jgi:uncharacterized protein YecE (DUF72 family)
VGGRILVGTASWTDKTLLASGWYPEEADDAASRLEYYASQFPLVEVDSTYYTPPNERNSQLWVERTPDGFTFDIKAYSLLTQHPTRTASLYKDLRPETDKRNVYPKDLDVAVVDQVWERFLAALEPLHRNGRLGSLLFQFPPWFGIRQSNKHYILECKRRCEPYRICVELRNSTWMSEENVEETLDFLTSYAVPYVVVDMPQGYRSSIPPSLRRRRTMRSSGSTATATSGRARTSTSASATCTRRRAQGVGAEGAAAGRAGEGGARADEQLLPRLRPDQRAPARAAPGRRCGTRLVAEAVSRAPRALTCGLMASRAPRWV